ncbi:MAG: class I SAM-dependent methyltransferase [Chloroflexota bacterium]|nr:MAG: class I SAM-dependent methyltransferase [Chloroflexota bacterium]
MSNPEQQSKGSHLARRAWRWLVGLGFHLLYNEMAWAYDGVSRLVSRGQWQAWQSAAIPHLNGHRILELAHGPGHMLLALEAAGYQVTGLDLSPAMGRIAGRRIRRAERRAVLVRGRAQNLPFASGAFDSVLTTFPTEFLVEQATIEAVFRVLCAGGRLVVVPQARLAGGGLSSLVEWLYTITGQRPQELGDTNGGFWQVIHERFSAAGFETTLEAAKFETSEVIVVVAEKPLEVDRRAIFVTR